MRQPAHKDLENPPGQINNYPKCYAAAHGGCYCDGHCLRILEEDKTLNDYIKRKNWNDISKDIQKDWKTQ